MLASRPARMLTSAGLRRTIGGHGLDDQPGISPALLQRLLDDDESLLDQRDANVEALLIERLYHNSFATRYLPIPMLFGAFVMYKEYLTWWHIAGLTLLYAAGTFYLDYQRDRYTNSAPLITGGGDWGLRFTVGSAITGITWGLLGWFCYPPGDFALQAVLGVAWAGLLISAMSTRAVHLPAYYAFMITMSVPPYTRALLEREPSAIYMSFFGIILMISLSFVAQMNNRRERLAIALRLRNAKLIGDLDRARAVAESSRAEIEHAYRAMLGEFAAAQRLSSHGSWNWQAASEQIGWSDEFYRLLGLAPQSCPAALAAWLERVHPEDRETVRGHYQRLRAGAERDQIRFRLNDRDHPDRALIALGESESDGNGQVARIHGIVIPAEDRTPMVSRA
jgi:PAS domain-containing protein